MNLAILASVIILGFVLHFGISSANRKDENAMNAYFERERKANFTRKKSIDNLDYITIPDFLMNLDEPDADIRVQDAIRIVNSLHSEKVLNLTGYTNTDLKLEYGTANINLLSTYDQNYTELARALNTLGDYYYKTGNLELAQKILEFAISTNTDVSSSYILLANIYLANNQSDRIGNLIQTASNLRSAMSNYIVKSLNDLA